MTQKKFKDFSLACCFHQHALQTMYFTRYRYELKIRSSSLLVSPMTNFSSWTILMPLYNSSEVFEPAKQYGITIHSPWILKRLNVTHYCDFVYFWSHLQAKSLFLNAQQLTLILVKTLWFIYINAVFAPYIDCVRSYSKHLYQNKGRISHVCYVSR